MTDNGSYSSRNVSSVCLDDEKDISINVTEITVSSEPKAQIQNDSEENSLLPTDGGRPAWTFMIGAVIIDAVIWGFPLNFGVFQNYYASHEPFRGNSCISMIGTFATGIAYLGGPLMTPLTIKLHRYRQCLVLFGACLCVIGNLGSSFATSMWVLVLCQGVIYGTGFLIISYSVFSMLNEWFVKRRGLAYGILLSAAGVSGLGLPFLLQTLLGHYGYAKTLRIYVLATVIIVGPAILLLRSRTRHLKSDPNEKAIDYSALRKPIFPMLSMCNFLQGLVFYLPGIFLPSYGTAISLSTTESSILLAILNLTQVIGTLLVGYLSDFIDIHILLTISCLGSSITVFTLWGLSHTMITLSLFSISYGFLAGSFESLFPRFATALTDNPDAELTVYGLFEFERGLGMVLAGPISSVLIKQFEERSGYGMRKYAGIVVFVGSALLVSSWAGVGWFVRGRKWYRCVEHE